MKRAIFAVGLLLAACTTALATPPQEAAAPAAPQRAQFDLGRPYLGGPLPGGLQLVLPPPAPDSARMLRDLEVNEAAMAGQGGPRWQLAARDAFLGPGWVGNAFSCSAGVTISDATTPVLANLLRRTATDFAMSAGAVKDHYNRQRPFAANGTPSCTPDDEAGLAHNGSYPSGHSAMGFGTGLVLAAVLPDHAAALVRRGRQFGESRALCNVHWQSDVEAGQLVASATFARLQSDGAYRADVEAARAELATAQPLDAAAQAACQADEAVLGD
ncbi:MAG: phosphatase PAP2 family protein [Erythrobacter sp.]|nr:phosphatase PAP2 family protein [Erythrobacter sp.]